MQTSVRTIPAWLTILLAASCGLIVANLYYAQPLVGPISSTLKLSAAAAGLIVALTQMGYCLGLLFIVPLGDLIENRRLILSLILICMLATIVTASVHSPIPFLFAAIVTGLGAVAVQVLVPYAAHLAPEESRGHVVGNVMSGLMFGIMLARPAASLVTHLFSWRTVFALSAALMALLSAILFRWLPERFPESTTRYGALLRSMIPAFRTTPILRRRALYHFCLFGAFSLFWTTVPLYLAGPAYHLSPLRLQVDSPIGVGPSP
jgi:predicted MFS family arabinose efflux permease